MRPKDEEALKEQARDISVQEGSAYSVMDGFGLHYLTPYALALGANNTHIGIINTLPSLLGSFAEEFTIDAMKHRTRKFIVASTVLLQAFLWFAMIGVGALYFNYGIDHEITPTLLIFVYSLLIIAGTISTPAWTSWLKDILPEKYNSYLGMRSRIMGLIVMISAVLAGFILDYNNGSKIFYGFIIIFSIAFLGRFISGLFFVRQYEPEYIPTRRVHDGFFHFLKTIWKTNYGHFTAFASMMSFAVNIASPFFAVYMLDNLHFTKTQFGVISITSLITTIIFMPFWGRFGDMYGNKAIMKITGYCVPFVALLWFTSSWLYASNPALAFPYLICVESFSGFAWSGFNLATADFVFDAVKRQRVASKTAHFQILNNFGGFIGALIGGIFASMHVFVIGMDTILLVMLLSALLRFATTFFTVNKIKEVKPVREFTSHEAKEKLLHLTPMTIVKMVR